MNAFTLFFVASVIAQVSSESIKYALWGLTKILERSIITCLDMDENSIIKHSNLKMFYNRIFELLRCFKVEFANIRSFRVFYNRICMHIFASDETSSNTSRFISVTPRKWALERLE